MRSAIVARWYLPSHCLMALIPRGAAAVLLPNAGAVAVSAPLSGITVTKGEDKLTEYRFNTGTARHFFCSVCGIYTFHQRRSNPNEYGVNVACFENVSPFDFPEVTVMDGLTILWTGIVGFLAISFRKK
jgi:hypothetical protein